jgi:hypothetical protein
MGANEAGLKHQYGEVISSPCNESTHLDGFIFQLPLASLANLMQA